MSLTTPPASELTVLILTRDRRETLIQALHSVSCQTYSGMIRILVIWDGCGELDVEFALAGNSVSVGQIAVHGDMLRKLSPIARVAVLRNLGLSLVETPLVAFLDDDNVLDPEHFESVVGAMTAASASAAHSWRVLVDDDDRAVAPDRYPWHPHDAEAVHRFEILCRLDMMSVGSAVVRDRATALCEGVDYGMVDCGEWVFETEFLRRFRFEVQFTTAEILEMVGEDDKLLRAIKASGARISCTERATLRYRLGGFSNRYRTKPSRDGGTS